MMKAELLNIDTGKAKAVTLSDEIFSLEPRKDILNRVVRWQLFNVLATSRLSLLTFDPIL